MRGDAESVEYLLKCSTKALENFRLNQRNKRAEMLKIAIEAFKEAVVAGELALLADLLYEYGPQLIAGEIRREEDERAVTTKPGPTYWRAEMRRMKKAG